MPRPALLRSTLSTAVLATLLAACGDGVLEPRLDDDRGVYVVEVADQGLVQRISFSAVTPAKGDTLRIRSVVVNEGRPRIVTTRMCGLDVDGLDLRRGIVCAGYSMRGELPVGDSVAQWHVGVVESAAGSHRVRIRHLLDPERWLTVDLRVARQ